MACLCMEVVWAHLIGLCGVIPDRLCCVCAIIAGVIISWGGSYMGCGYGRLWGVGLSGPMRLE